ncbi:MAG: 30S ribosomal protein S8 [Clostridia bacterium]|nr:30S ribosomal protein S8 [Clostridia bacterium]
MVTTDPIADLLTRIRNALTARHESVLIPASKMKKSIADILVSEGYVKSAEIVDDEGHPNIKIVLKYGNKYESVISNLKRISKPGLRVYAGYEELPKVLGGLGIAIISTSKGIMTDREARKNKVGGEVLAYVW